MGDRHRAARLDLLQKARDDTSVAGQDIPKPHGGKHS